MFDDLKGKVAIVTGSSRPARIGRAIAMVLAESGMQVVAHDVDDEAEVFETARLIGGHAAMADLGTPEGPQSLIEQAMDRYGRLDVMVNNAARWFEAPAMETSSDMWDRLMAINLRGTFLCCQAAARVMLASPSGGSIINISSLGGQMPVPDMVAYSASKGGIDAMTRALACEWAPHVRVNAVSPGHINTDENVEYVNNTQERKQRFKERVLMQKLGEASQIGHAVAYLASECSHYITGQVITIDGGLSAWQGKL